MAGVQTQKEREIHLERKIKGMMEMKKEG